MTGSISTRRGFITTSSALAASGLIAPRLRAAAEDKLSLGVIGVGGRGRANLGGVRKEDIAVICDTNPAALAAAAKTYPDARAVSDWREVVTDHLYGCRFSPAHDSRY